VHQNSFLLQAVSVSLPSWKSTIGYEEGEDWVLSKMRTGYPRFFIHLIIQELEQEILSRYGKDHESTMLFPSRATASRCQQFMLDKEPSLNSKDVYIINLIPFVQNNRVLQERQSVISSLSCVLFPSQYFKLAKQVWQHSGDGISSRRGEFYLKALQEGLLYREGDSPSPRLKPARTCKGPRRYQKNESLNGTEHSTGESSGLQSSPKIPLQEGKEYFQFVEERFGRNLNAALAAKAKLAIRRRIAGCLVEDEDLDKALTASADVSGHRVIGLSEEDVYLFPAGMSSIFNTHRILMANRGEPLKSICFGFPYIDTLKILEKWGPGCLFYGHGSEADLDDLERRLEQGKRYLALFTEFPGNPLLNTPNLKRIRSLADKYDFALVVDETIGNFINVNTLSRADVVVSSLTKVFSGDSNVMGGSAVYNPHGRMYQSLKKTLVIEYEDNYWAEDAVFMERNSRDFVSRIERVNVNAETIADILHSSPLVKQVYYPKNRPSKAYYDQCRNAGGGYGGLLSVTFRHVEEAVVFFDALEVQKGPSLGTNFTLSSPYTILAHYDELDWAAQFGVDADLVRISVGLENDADLAAIFERALSAVERLGLCKRITP
jgi:cystathionine gamma-synthase